MTSITTEEKEKLEKKWRRYKRKYFKDRTSFTGLEMQKCHEEFCKKYNVSFNN